MSGDLVLITGATGLVGFGVLRAALEHGYRLRAAVRSEQKAEIIRSNPTLKGISEEQLSFVIVPDILADGAFDEAVKGVKFILHVASPVPRLDLTGYDDLDAEIVQPAIQGTVGIFKSAQKAGGVQRIVVTSSGAALVPMSAFTGTTDEVVGPDSRGEPLPSPYMNNAQIAYNASKIHALKHAEDFIATEQPGFDAVHIHPVIVLGRNELALKAAEVDNGSLSFAIGPVIGRHHPTPFPLTVTSLTSVALAHVRALDPKVPGNQSYLLANKGDEGYHWDDVKEYAKKHFPKAIEDGTLPNNGSMTGFGIKADVSKTEEILGIREKTFEEMMIEVIGQYVELAKKEKAQ